MTFVVSIYPVPSFSGTITISNRSIVLLKNSVRNPNSNIKDYLPRHGYVVDVKEMRILSLVNFSC